ncbi:MAG: hypothetical protein LBF40_00460 [Deltaproteobacteria bacterium]|nr:hypothetical protein [Deltaproteobacteria bacterium]
MECIREHYVFGLPVLSANTSGGFLFWLLWVIEFVLYETPVVVMGYRYAGEPYEEDMQEWLLKQKLENPFVLLPTDPKEINAVFGRIAEGDISYFLTAPPAKHPHGSFLGLDIYYSEGAPDACVTVKHHIHTVKRRSKTILLEYLMIPEVQAERIMRHLG